MPKQLVVPQDCFRRELSSSCQRLPLIYHPQWEFHVCIVREYRTIWKAGRKKGGIKGPKSAESWLGEKKKISEGLRLKQQWKKNPWSVALGLLSTVVLIGIMTGFLGTLLLQLIKLTLRGLLQPCNDYLFFLFFFFHGKVGKVIWKEFGELVFFFFFPPSPFSAVEGFWVSSNHRPESGSRAPGKWWQAQRGGQYWR